MDEASDVQKKLHDEADRIRQRKLEMQRKQKDEIEAMAVEEAERRANKTAERRYAVNAL